MGETGVRLRPSEIRSADRGGGNRTIPLVTPRVGTRQMLNGITVIAPGSAIRLHSHNCEESVIVLEGRAIAEIGAEAFDLQPHDTTWIPANVPHRFRNASEDAELRIFWTYASVEATRTMAETGETHSIASEHVAKAPIHGG